MNNESDGSKIIEKRLLKFNNYEGAINYLRSRNLTLDEKKLIRNKNSEFLERLQNIKSPVSKVTKVPDIITKVSDKIENRIFSPFEKIVYSVRNSLGHEVASHFKFYKWLTSNTITTYFLSIFSFVCIPHIIFWFKNYTTLNEDDNENLICFKEKSNSSSYLSTKIDYLEIILYGCFPGKNEPYKYKLNYNMQYAYLLSMILFFLSWLIMIGFALIKSITKSYIQKIKLENSSVFSRILFCSWPYYSNKKGYLEEKNNQLYTHLILARSNKVQDYKRLHVLLKILGIFVLNLAFFAGFAYLCTLVYYYLSDKNLDKYNFTEDERNLIFSGFVVLFNYLSPIFFKLLAKFENLNRANKFNLLRMFLVQIGIFGLLIAFLFENRHKCWENEFAKQILTIIILDFIVLLLDLFAMLFYRFVVNKFYPKHEILFNISFYTMNSIFSQLLLWCGIYFSPYLGIIQIIKLLLIFLIHSYLVKTIYKVSRNGDISFNNESYFLVITLISFILTIVGLVGLNVLVDSSKTCGPFNEIEYPKPYDYLLRLKSELINIKAIGIIFQIIFSPGLMAFILFLLSVFMYASVTVSRSYKQTIKYLKNSHEDKKKERKMLIKRKNFLIKMLDQIEGEEQPRPKMSRVVYVRSQSEAEQIEMLVI